MNQQTDIIVGVDLGQKRDPSAFCITEIGERETGERIGRPFHEKPVTERVWLVRQIERLPLGQPYPAQADRIAEVVEQLTANPRYRVTVAIDQTGVGAPVVDIVRGRLHDSRAHVCGVTLVASGKMTGTLRRRECSVGKEFLVSRMSALLSTSRIQLPESDEGREAGRELADFEIRRTEKANLISGAFKKGTHDDLVIALGLSVLYEPLPPATTGPSIWQ